MNNFPSAYFSNQLNRTWLTDYSEDIHSQTLRKGLNISSFKVM